MQSSVSFDHLNELSWLTGIPIAFMSNELHCARITGSYYPILARAVLERLDDQPTACYELAEGFFAACLRAPDNSALLFGPVSMVKATHRYAQQLAKALQRPNSESGMLQKYLNEIPSCSLDRLAMLLRMTAGMLFGMELPVSEVLPGEPPMRRAAADRPTTMIHDNADYERTLYSYIRFGNAAALEQFLSETRSLDPIAVGGDDYRAFIGPLIASVGVASHTANEGGLPYGIAMNMADEYIRRIERASSMRELYGIHREMLVSYARLVEHWEANQAESPVVYRVRGYVNQRLSENLNTQDIADALGYSRSYLSSHFTKQTGMTLNGYILQKKIEEAKRMLVTSPWSIQRIADALGFSSQGWFCTVFKRQTGYSPSEFRRQRTFLNEGKY